MIFLKQGFGESDSNAYVDVQKYAGSDGMETKKEEMKEEKSQAGSKDGMYGL